MKGNIGLSGGFRITTSFFIGMTLLFLPLTLFSQEHNEKETRALIGNVEEKLNVLKKSGDASIYKEEISMIQELFNLSRKYLDQKKIDLAYYNAGIADSYFTLIETKREHRSASEKYGSGND